LQIPYPSKAELLACLPPELFSIKGLQAWGSLMLSLGLSLLAYGIGGLIPLRLWAAPLWLLYALITGTAATGCWVIAHECGHGAFHPNRRVESAVGFVLHSLLLVPYYTWQRSHAVHHDNCNHLEGGETHVPPRAESWMGRVVAGTRRRLGPWPFGNLGVLLMLLALGLAAVQFSLARVLCVYGLPWLVGNAWLVGYTWLQHTETDIPHVSSPEWTWAKGALETVDHPYGPLLNLLHHGIGSTHVCHHINPCIPHCNAWQAKALLRQRFPDLVRHDPTPVHRALWRVATRCSVVRQQAPGSGFFYLEPLAP